MKLKGIDVSIHNGTINWGKVKASGIDFAMIRAGYGSNTIDKQFKRNITECNRLGIKAGIYWFSYALTPKQAAIEAKFCLELIKDYKVDFPVAYDLEDDNVNRYAKKYGVNIDKALASNMANAFLSVIKEAGYLPANYANLDYLRIMFTDQVTNKYDLWLAQWTEKPTYAGNFNLWQYNSKGKVDGIETDVDLNIAYTDYNNEEQKLSADDIFKVTGLSNYNDWMKAKDAAIKAAEADGNLGDLEIMKYFNDLVVKLYYTR